MTSSGLATHVKFNGSDRINLNQTNTTIQGDAAVAGSLAVSNVLSASRLEATGSLLNSHPDAGVFCGLVPTVGFASCVLNSISSSSISQIEFQYVGATQPHAALVSNPSQDEFTIRMNSTLALNIPIASLKMYTSPRGNKNSR